MGRVRNETNENSTTESDVLSLPKDVEKLSENRNLSEARGNAADVTLIRIPEVQTQNKMIKNSTTMPTTAPVRKRGRPPKKSYQHLLNNQTASSNKSVNINGNTEHNQLPISKEVLLLEDNIVGYIDITDNDDADEINSNSQGQEVPEFGNSSSKYPSNYSVQKQNSTKNIRRTIALDRNLKDGNEKDGLRGTPSNTVYHQDRSRNNNCTKTWEEIDDDDSNDCFIVNSIEDDFSVDNLKIVEESNSRKGENHQSEVTIVVTKCPSNSRLKRQSSNKSELRPASTDVSEMGNISIVNGVEMNCLESNSHTECRRSQRKKVMKYNVVDLLNKGKKKRSSQVSLGNTSRNDNCHFPPELSDLPSTHKTSYLSNSLPTVKNYSLSSPKLNAGTSNKREINFHLMNDVKVLLEDASLSRSSFNLKINNANSSLLNSSTEYASLKQVENTFSDHEELSNLSSSMHSSLNEKLQNQEEHAEMFSNLSTSLASTKSANTRKSQRKNSIIDPVFDSISNKDIIEARNKVKEIFGTNKTTKSNKKQKSTVNSTGTVLPGAIAGKRRGRKKKVPEVIAIDTNEINSSTSETVINADNNDNMNCDLEYFVADNELTTGVQMEIEIQSDSLQEVSLEGDVEKLVKNVIKTGPKSDECLQEVISSEVEVSEITIIEEYEDDTTVKEDVNNESSEQEASRENSDVEETIVRKENSVLIEATKHTGTEYDDLSEHTSNEETNKIPNLDENEMKSNFSNSSPKSKEHKAEKITEAGTPEADNISSFKDVLEAKTTTENSNLSLLRESNVIDDVLTETVPTKKFNSSEKSVSGKKAMDNSLAKNSEKLLRAEHKDSKLSPHTTPIPKKSSKAVHKNSFAIKGDFEDFKDLPTSSTPNNVHSKQKVVITDEVRTEINKTKKNKTRAELNSMHSKNRDNDSIQLMLAKKRRKEKLKEKDRKNKSLSIDRQKKNEEAFEGKSNKNEESMPKRKIDSLEMKNNSFPEKKSHVPEIMSSPSELKPEKHSTKINHKLNPKKFSNKRMVNPPKAKRELKSFEQLLQKADEVIIATREQKKPKKPSKKFSTNTFLVDSEKIKEETNSENIAALKEESGNVDETNDLSKELEKVEEKSNIQEDSSNSQDLAIKQEVNIIKISSMDSIPEIAKPIKKRGRPRLSQTLELIKEGSITHNLVNGISNTIESAHENVILSSTTKSQENTSEQNMHEEEKIVENTEISINALKQEENSLEDSSIEKVKLKSENNEVVSEGNSTGGDLKLSLPAIHCSSEYESNEVHLSNENNFEEVIINKENVDILPSSTEDKFIHDKKDEFVENSFVENDEKPLKENEKIAFNSPSESNPHTNNCLNKVNEGDDLLKIIEEKTSKGIKTRPGELKKVLRDLKKNWEEMYTRESLKMEEELNLKKCPPPSKAALKEYPEELKPNYVSENEKNEDRSNTQEYSPRPQETTDECLEENNFYSKENENEELKENIGGHIRRSNRIKSISKSKLKSVGRGLVRDRERFGIKDEDKSQETEERSNTVVLSKDFDTGSEEFLRELEIRLNQFQQIRDNEYKCERIISKEAKKMTCDCFLTAEEAERGELGCGEDCLNRLLMIECGPKCIVGDRCTNRRFQKNLYSTCKIFRTEKKGFGIMADEEILPGEFIMEYVGEVLNDKQFQKRAEAYSQDKNKHYYFMALRSDAIIDATKKGNISRFINHSCDPNAETQKWTVNGELRIGFFSKKRILQGEEITFDYQFQRYGKEAQKCFCESVNCRGWIGEEPDSDEEEEDVGESGSESESTEDDSVSNAEAKKIRLISEKDTKQRIEKEDEESSNEIEDELLAIKTKLDALEKKKSFVISTKIPGRRKRGRPRREFRVGRKMQQYVEDPELESEIRSLSATGLKNQAQTLRFNRLMVRAKMPETRLQLLEVLQKADVPCRRLFLDYHGLRLLHGWMNECEGKENEKDLEICLLITKALKDLPIPNKTMLKDSKVYQVIQNWSSSVRQEKELESVSPDEQKEIQNDISSQDDGTKVETNKDIKTELKEISTSLIGLWEVLPEVFRIPKRERIEQMKEHEREADLQYKSLNSLDEDVDQDRSSERFERFGKKIRPSYNRENVIEIKRRKIDKPDDNNAENADGNDTSMARQLRRQMFAAKVAAAAAEKRLVEVRREFETKCKFFGLDPKKVNHKDLPFCVNPATGQWYTVDKREIATPPSHAHIKVCPKPKSINPTDYELPPMDLPPLWKFAIDPKGRIYYYHIKTKIPQWEPPPKVFPLQNTEHQNDYVPGDANKVVASPENSETKNKSFSDSELEEEHIPEEDEKEQEEDVAKLTSEELKEKRKHERYNYLVQERSISPRRKEDRIYNRMEMKKYKENKAKIRRRREEIKRKKMLAGEQDDKLEKDGTEQEKAISEGLPLPIQDYLYSSDENDDKEDDVDSLLLTKFACGDKIVDELDALKKEKLKRPLQISDSSDQIKRKHAKLEENKDKNSSSSSSTKSNNNNSSCKEPSNSDSSGKLLSSSSTPSSTSGSSSTKHKTRKAKEKFRCDIAGIIVQHLTPYLKESCRVGRITKNEDFKHLARKLTHFVLLKELKHCDSTGQPLEVTESVKNKSREFIRKYMAKYGKTYVRPKNDPEFKDIPHNKE